MHQIYNNKHKHEWHGCEHNSLGFCKQCQVPYCKDCGREWNSSTSTYYWNNQTPYWTTGALQQYLSKSDVTANTGDPNSVTTTACNHSEK